MSEQPISEEMAQSAKDRAISYIQYRDATRFGKDKKVMGKGQKIGSELPIPKGSWKGSEVDMVTAYEGTIGKMNDHIAKRALEGLRPAFYDVARVARWLTLSADFVIGGMLFPKIMDKVASKSTIGRLAGKAAGVIGTVVFRPAELALSGVAKVTGFIGREISAPIANAILGGGRPKELPKTA